MSNVKLEEKNPADRAIAECAGTLLAVIGRTRGASLYGKLVAAGSSLPDAGKRLREALRLGLEATDATILR